MTPDSERSIRTRALIARVEDASTEEELKALVQTDEARAIAFHPIHARALSNAILNRTRTLVRKAH